MLLDASNFGDRLLSLVSVAMPLDGFCYYRVIDECQITDHRIWSLSPYWLDKYSSYYWRHDPCHPSRVKNPTVRSHTIDTTDRTQSTSAREYLAGFLAPQKTRYQTELYFRHKSRIVAGASLLRDVNRGAFSCREIGLLEELVDFSGGGPTEPSIDDFSRLTENALHSWLDGFALTAREREIAVLLGQALTNKDICRELNIALPTVKTHVGQLFRKCGAANRNVFLRRLLSADFAPCPRRDTGR